MKQQPSPIIFFICNDAERALGLELALDNFHIVCIDDNPIVDFIRNQGGKVFCLERELGELNPIFRNSNKLLWQPSVQTYISKNTPDRQTPNVIFFKIASNLERTCESLGYKILNTTSSLNKKFELKLSQYQSLKDVDVHFPKTRIVALGESRYSELSQNLGSSFVIQYDRGHTGTGTVFINSEDDYEKEKSMFPKRMARVSQKIEGEAWTLNACVTRFGVAYGGLSYQITGVSECTSAEGGTVGNDWSVSKQLSQPDLSVRQAGAGHPLSEATSLQQISEITKNAGERMSKGGFRGLFGLDFVIDKSGEVFLIEINARQPASIGMHTKLMLQEGFIPLQLFHIAEFLFGNDDEYIAFINSTLSKNFGKEDFQNILEKQNKVAIKPIRSAQIILRNTEDKKVKIVGEFLSGQYSFDKSLIRISGGYSVTDVQLKDSFLILAVGKGHEVSSGMEIARIQALCGLVLENGEVKPWVLETIRIVKDRLL